VVEADQVDGELLEDVRELGTTVVHGW